MKPAYHHRNLGVALRRAVHRRMPAGGMAAALRRKRHMGACPSCRERLRKMKINLLSACSIESAVRFARRGFFYNICNGPRRPQEMAKGYHRLIVSPSSSCLLYNVNRVEICSHQ